MSIQLLTRPSIVQAGRALITVNGCEPFILHVSNLNYFSFIKPESVKQITYDIEAGIVIIHLDLNAICHCYERWLTINMRTAEILWNEAIPTDVKTLPVEKDAIIFKLKSKNE
jgi:hypothetical protein